MRHLVIIASFLLLNTCKILAQETQQVPDVLKALSSVMEAPALPTNEVINHIGSEVYIRDTISGYKVISKSLKLLYLGYPKRILTIIIKGKKVNKELAACNVGIGHFSGKAIIYKHKPAIIITNSDQTGIRIMI
jgi:hypothetical protein